MPLSHTRHTLYNIQALRAIAALLVILHHSLPHYEVMGGKLPFIKAISSWGFIGVDIFFIISGYIMAYTTFDKPRSLKSATVFTKHRLLRIYLGYWPFFFAMFYILYKKHRLDGLDLWGSFWLTNDNMFQLVLPVSWSLSYELYFYILFAITLLLPVTALKRFFPVFTGVFALVTYYLYLHPHIPQHIFYSHFLLEFFSGVLLFIYRERLMHNWLIPIALITAFLAYFYGISFETKNGLPRIATFGTGALMVVFLALVAEFKLNLKASRSIVSLGDASYTLYLSHLVLLELFYYVGIRDLFTSQNSILLPFLGLISIIFICIIFSLLYYRYIEKPVYQTAIRL